MIERATRLASEGRWPSDVEVWHVAMPLSEEGIDVAVLDATERTRASGYLQQRDRIRFQATRSVLRNLLGQRLDIAPAAVRFRTEARGRPALCDTESDFSFNVSHAGAHALIALSATRRVGIDVERIDPTLDWRTLLDLVCTQEEQTPLSDIKTSPDLLRQRFFQCWTAKEALLKALGLGIADGLQSLSIDFRDDAVPRVGASVPLPSPLNDVALLRYCWLHDMPGYMGCLAYDATTQCAMR